MALRSKLFTSDAAVKVRLDACLQRDSEHILLGARGAHVSKIQSALFAILPGLELPDNELFDKKTGDGFYGPKTAEAVVRYKQNHKPPIINRAYQDKADRIVGKMTIQALDDDMFAKEPVDPPKPAPSPIQDERVVFRKTAQIVKTKHEPGEPGLGDGAFKLLFALTAIAHDLSAIKKRVTDHPLETGDPDFGDEVSRRQRPVDHDLILLKVDVAVTVKALPPERFIGFFNTVRSITREYTYEYGVGLPVQQVIVNRTVTVIENDVDPPFVTKGSSFAPQPSNFLNP